MIRSILFSLCSICIGAVGSVDPVIAESAKKYGTELYEKLQRMQEKQEERIRVATYNILFNLKEEERPFAYRFSERLPRLVEAIRHMDPDILCVQELHPSQLSDLRPLLEDRFDVCMPERGEGELNAIFYRKDRLQLLADRGYRIESGSHFFISDFLMTARFLDKKTDRTFAVFNVHLAFSPPDVRLRQCRQILWYREQIASDVPLFLAGDMNTFPNRPDLSLIPFLDGDYLIRALRKGGLFDAREESLGGHTGPFSTFTNAPPSIAPFEGFGTPGVFLDHIFVSEGIEVYTHTVDPFRSEELFPSDHMPVVVDCIIP